MTWLERNWPRALVHGAGMAALVWLGAVYVFALVPLPDRYIMLHSGTWGLVFLMATLACTPLRRWVFARAIQVRRALGLYAFAFICIHIAVYAVAENGLDVNLIVRDLDERRAMLIGFAAFLLLIPLAATSTAGWQRRLGKRWRRLHRLVYAAAILSVWHYLWLDRDIITTPLIYAALVGGLLALRFVWRVFPVRLQGSRRSDPLDGTDPHGEIPLDRDPAIVVPGIIKGENMSHEYIEIHGARENNLKNVSLRIPKRKITVFTGVSGSGKSSIVFDTIAAEAQRQLYETFSMFVRNFLPRYAQPDADSIENLGMAIVVDQKRLGGGSHSTMGTITDIYTVLRLLFARVGQPFAGYSNVFSFNDPQGMCPECNGLGRKLQPIVEKFYDPAKSLREGAIQGPVFDDSIYMASGFFDNDKKLSEFTKQEMDLLLFGQEQKFKMETMNRTYLGVITGFTRSYIERDLKTRSERTQEKVAQYLTEGPCPACKGARLNQAVLSCKINGYNIAELSALEVGELIGVIKGIKGAVAKPMVDDLVNRLQHVVDIGLDYLTLNRETDTLSGGEAQRVKLVKQLSSSLIDVMYIFDEPSVGLHPRDVHRLNEMLQKLRAKGNTVLVVEHDPDVIKVADHIVDVGPHAGTQGGEIVYEGSYAGLLEAHTLTGKFMREAMPIKKEFRQAKTQLTLSKVNVNNLKNVSVSIPVGVLTVVTGVAGSGKSSLINEAFVAQFPEAIVIDQSAVGVSSRSNPATYSGMMDDVRKAFAKANKVDAGLFSFNSKGACENCQGLGVVYTDLSFFETVKSPCEVCRGKRFKDEVLAYKLHGKSIIEVLDMTVRQALEQFDQPEIQRKLQTMSDVGLDYLTLGQPLNTLSGGECQRIKLASELHKEGSIYVMDEPTTGLHKSDMAHLLEIINKLVDGGNTVIVIEHNMDVVRNADWIIDLGPEGGSRGGQVIFEGTPADLKQARQSITSQYI